MPTPAEYEACYHTARGDWIARQEFTLLNQLMQPAPGTTLLDVGTGTGHFARRFAARDLQVVGLDPDREALDYACSLGGDVAYLQGSALCLPFADQSFDYCCAITSLCFIADPALALQEMWRVARRGVVLGLLHRHSLLHRQKRGHGAYAGARWDDMKAVRHWSPTTRLRHGYALFLPDGGPGARLAELLLPRALPFGGFLAVALYKPIA